MFRKTLTIAAALAAVVLLTAHAALLAQSVVEEALKPFVDSGAIPGAVSVLVKDGQVTFDCVGWTNIDKKTPIKRDSLFWIASQTKEFVGIGILLLAEEGKLSIEDEVEKYLPEFADVRVAEENEDGTITLRPPKTKPVIRQMLCHTSGLPFITPEMNQVGLDAIPVRPLAAVIAGTALTQDPGTKYSYSNIGIDTGAAIIEVVSGQPFAEFLDERIFKPLGMVDTTFWPNDEQLSRLVSAYHIEEDGSFTPTTVTCLHYPLSDRAVRFAEGGGGLFSTPQDMIRYLVMLSNKGVYEGKRVLSESIIDQLSTKQTEEGIEENYSFGMGAGEWIGHGGAMGTFGAANFSKGWAKLWMIQLYGCYGEARKAWDEAANKFFSAE
ncbi:MAG: beta-lactamase family protein [Thermoguttaceae bacterium]|nr:beta-lactamase family protein [Thermoguttaceae bacterium]